MAFALRRGTRSIALSLLAATALASGPAFSDGFTISGPTTGPQVMDHDGDIGTVTSGGSISLSVSGRGAVEMLEANQKLTNDGSLAAAGIGSLGIASGGQGAIIVNNGLLRADSGVFGGIFALGDRTRITNSGMVEVGGTNVFGIDIKGENSSVSNSGTIRAVGNGSLGIVAAGSGGQVKNSGKIGTTGEGSTGIIVGDPDPSIVISGVTVLNDGSIHTSGQASFGVAAHADRVSITNHGAIDSSGQAAGGIVVWGNDASISNSGSIRVSGATSVGIGVGLGNNAAIRNSGSVIVDGATSVAIEVGSNNAVVSNSGTIFNNGDAAILFAGNNATLNLLAGTRIQGAIVFQGADNTATFGSGLNAMMTFSGTGVPTIIRTDGLPFVVSGNTVAVLDTAGFGTAGSVVADLTGNIAGAIEDRLTQVRRERIVGAALGLRGGHGIGAGEEGTAVTGIGPAFWATAIGGYRKQNGSGIDFHTSLGGVVVGADTDINEFWRGGVFLGGAGGSSHVDGSDQDIDNSSFFGGGYLGYTAGLNFADLSLSVGSFRQDSDRRIANNMVDGGLETAHARSNGTYVSPALTVGTHVIWNDTMFVPTLRLRYAGLFLDGYSETGGGDALRVDSRDVHVFEARGQIALPLAPHVTENGIWATTLRAGIDGIAQSRGNVSATLLGQDIEFTPAGHRSAVRGFAGADFNFITDSRLQWQATVEAGYGSDSAFIATGRAGLSIPF
ncbi:autotransporter outer membrane beta-barrel domain-containing protein [Pseudaminobacter soli (ex Li et al. 2025)]|uniref:Autotransporter domain-containing protein n=1 Tax=Pseudaminobacter soli (ex Li et al. 2025) TaxID=1295366 RepID=A0A2P7S6M2_9HYPH|nr:autotransporter outer membrane beta-barrel domain-containing protein [Mesorhizobium soli]PSJ58124.1 hypothetical protein C7I85_19825 [Mesorhizobium soli]